MLREEQGRIIKGKTNSIFLTVSGVTEMLTNRVAIEYESTVNYYDLSNSMRLLPFIRNVNLLPEKYRKTFKKWGLGIWLDLYDSE